MINFDKETSSVGACCPMPLIKLETAIQDMEKGTILKITGDDPIFESGVRDYCEVKRYEVVNVQELDNHTVIFIKV